MIYIDFFDKDGTRREFQTWQEAAAALALDDCVPYHLPSIHGIATGDEPPSETFKRVTHEARLIS